jgi:hypothetical protein
MKNYTFTKVGVVENTDKKQVFFAIASIVQEMRSKNELLSFLIDDGQTAFAKEYMNDIMQMQDQLQSLVMCTAEPEEMVQ